MGVWALPSLVAGGMARRWERVRLGQQAAKPPTRELVVAAWGGWKLGRALPDDARRGLEAGGSSWVAGSSFSTRQCLIQVPRLWGKDGKKRPSVIVHVSAMLLLRLGT